MNGDGLLNSLDIDAFVAYLTGHAGATGMRAEYAWDAENRLTAVTPTAPQAGDKKLLFAYDYLGRRIEKQVFDWDDQAADWQATPSVQRKFVWGGTDAGGWLMLMELDGSDNLVRKYTWGLDLAGQHGSGNSLEAAGGIGGLLAVAQAQVGGGSASGGVDAGEYVFTYDANGNVAQVLDLSAGSAAAAIVAHYEYDPYGGVVNHLSGYTYAEANPIRFSTKYHDAETGLGYWGYRYYSARLGRWLSRDPLEEQGGLNLYVYALNSPTVLNDPFGLMSACEEFVDRVEALLMKAGASDASTDLAGRYVPDRDGWAGWFQWWYFKKPSHGQGRWGEDFIPLDQLAAGGADLGFNRCLEANRAYNMAHFAGLLWAAMHYYDGGLGISAGMRVMDHQLDEDLAQFGRNPSNPEKCAEILIDDAALSFAEALYHVWHGQGRHWKTLSAAEQRQALKAGFSAYGLKTKLCGNIDGGCCELCCEARKRLEQRKNSSRNPMSSPPWVLGGRVGP